MTIYLPDQKKRIMIKTKKKMPTKGRNKSEKYEKRKLSIKNGFEIGSPEKGEKLKIMKKKKSKRKNKRKMKQKKQGG